MTRNTTAEKLTVLCTSECRLGILPCAQLAIEQVEVCDPDVFDVAISQRLITLFFPQVRLGNFEN